MLFIITPQFGKTAYLCYTVISSYELTPVVYKMCVKTRKIAEIHNKSEKGKS